MSIESSYEYKTWNLNIPGFLYDIFTTNFYKIPLLASSVLFSFFSDRSVFLGCQIIIEST
jgi:hypothetical protein